MLRYSIHHNYRVPLKKSFLFMFCLFVYYLIPSFDILLYSSTRRFLHSSVNGIANQPTHPFIYQSFQSSFHPSIHPSVHPCIHPSIHPLVIIHPFVYPPMCPPIHLSIHLFIHPPTLFIPPIHPILLVLSIPSIHLVYIVPSITKLHVYHTHSSIYLIM